jgi:hypothetical protein
VGFGFVVVTWWDFAWVFFPCRSRFFLDGRRRGLFGRLLSKGALLNGNSETLREGDRRRMKIRSRDLMWSACAVARGMKTQECRGRGCIFLYAGKRSELLEIFLRCSRTRVRPVVVWPIYAALVIGDIIA